MGFFKELSTLNRMGEEIRKDYDPVAQMAQAQLTMVHADEARSTGFASGSYEHAQSRCVRRAVLD